MLARWNNIPKLRRAQWIVQRLLGLLLMAACVTLSQPQVMPLGALIASWFLLIPFPVFVVVMGLCGILLVVWPSLSLEKMATLTLPLTLYIGQDFIATLTLHGSAVGIIAAVLLYCILLVTFWGFS